MLLRQIVPLIAAAISRGAVKAIGCEDPEELQSEGCAIAAEMLDSAEARGKDVEPASVAYYTLQQMKTGRRSGYSGRRDAMSPAAALDGKVQLRSMDEVMPADEDDFVEQLTLHDVLAGSAEDVDVTVARRMDWASALEQMDERMRDVVKGTAEGIGTGELAARYEVTAPRICQVREEAGERLLAAWGGDPLVDVTRESAWTRHVRTYAERRRCRVERIRA